MQLTPKMTALEAKTAAFPPRPHLTAPTAYILHPPSAVSHPPVVMLALNFNRSSPRFHLRQNDAENGALNFPWP